jgi:hypothetical protein
LEKVAKFQKNSLSEIEVTENPDIPSDRAPSASENSVQLADCQPKSVKIG